MAIIEDHDDYDKEVPVSQISNTDDEEIVMHNGTEYLFKGAPVECTECELRQVIDSYAHAQHIQGLFELGDHEPQMTILIEEHNNGN